MSVAKKISEYMDSYAMLDFSLVISVGVGLGLWQQCACGIYIFFLFYHGHLLSTYENR